jgi:flagellar protein FliO/FliZ
MKPFLLTLLLLPTQILAQEAASKQGSADAISSSSYLLKLSLGLVLVICLVFFLAWLVKKMHIVQNSNNGLINIISAISVGQRERIALIQVGEEQILIGLTQGRIDKLHTLKKPVDATQPSTVAASNFQQKFQQLLNKDKRDENA